MNPSFHLTSSESTEQMQLLVESPANIALIKYWGKFPGQLPMNPSLSFSLNESIVRLKLVVANSNNGIKGLSAFTYNHRAHPGFQQRIENYVHDMLEFVPLLRDKALEIHTESHFPHSAGIASSAAAFSALALALCEMENRLDGKASDNDAIRRKASWMARLGSGSACRSLYGGFAVWGASPEIENSDDTYAVQLDGKRVHADFFTLCDAVLIIDDSEKKVSSSAGHALMNAHTYREARRQQAAANLHEMLQYLYAGSKMEFMRLIEHEALSLHALMMASRPGYVLIRPNTLIALEAISRFREEKGIPLGYTLDAGPNIHLIYFSDDRAEVIRFIEGELKPLCRSGRWIDDAMGDGSRIVQSE